MSHNVQKCECQDPSCDLSLQVTEAERHVICEVKKAYAADNATVQVIVHGCKLGSDPDDELVYTYEKFDLYQG